MPVSAEDVLFAATEVRVDLAWQECVLGNVRPSRIAIQGQQEEPGDADDDAEQ